MCSTRQELLTRFYAAQSRPPSLDKGAVEAAFREHFQALGLDPLPVRWAPDAVEGFHLANQSALQGVLENEEYNYVLNMAEKNAAKNDFHVTLRLLARTVGLREEGFDQLLRAACWLAARRAYGSFRKARRENSWRRARVAIQDVPASVAKSLGWLDTASEMSWCELQQATLKLHQLWLPFVQAYEAGLWLYAVMEYEVLAIPRPLLRIHERRLHCEDGPAVCWPDGTSLWFYKNIHVTKQVIMRSQTLTAKQILQQRSIEVRRAMIERYGIERLLREVHAKKLDESAQGTLYRLEFPGDELTVVEVVCPSTGRKYFLCVPWWFQTVRQAVAWTFDLSAEQYQPITET